MKYKEQEILDTHACSKSALSKNLPGIFLQLRVEKHQARQNIKTTSVQVRVSAGAGSPESTKFAMDGVKN